jgi:hypothetical protein
MVNFNGGLMTMAELHQPRRNMKAAPALVLLTAVLLTSCTDPTKQNNTDAPEFAGGSSGPSAGGHVERDFTIFGVPIEKYSFIAHILGNGAFQGRFEVRDVFADGSEALKARGSVRCLTVEPDGRTARMGGVVDGSNDPELVGTEALWTVRDNGEGQNDPRDQATDLRFGQPPGVAEFHCAVGVPPEAFGTFGENERANVQVRP